MQSYTLLRDVVTQLKGSDRAEESLYLLGLSYFENKEYPEAAEFFKTYYQRYPKGKFTELARYYAGYAYYLDSPEAQLDQSETIKAIEELQGFLDYFPRSDKVTLAQNAIFEMQDKLTLKELQNAQLYYNLGNYMGNNYESAIITAKTPSRNIHIPNIRKSSRCSCSRPAIRKPSSPSTNAKPTASATLSMNTTASSTTIRIHRAARRPTIS